MAMDDWWIRVGKLMAMQVNGSTYCEMRAGCKCVLVDKNV